MYQNQSFGIPPTRQQVRYGFMGMYPYYVPPAERQRLYGFAGENIRKHLFGMQ